MCKNAEKLKNFRKSNFLKAEIFLLLSTKKTIVFVKLNNLCFYFDVKFKNFVGHP